MVSVFDMKIIRMFVKQIVLQWGILCWGRKAIPSGHVAPHSRPSLIPVVILMPAKNEIVGMSMRNPESPLSLFTSDAPRSNCGFPTTPNLRISDHFREHTFYYTPTEKGGRPCPGTDPRLFNELLLRTSEIGLRWNWQPCGKRSLL